jgi:hypothetical protein
MWKSGSRRKSVLASVLAVSTVTMAVGETRASPEPPAPRMVKMEARAEPAPRVGLRVDAEELGSGGESVEAKVEEVAAEVFAAEGFEGASEELDPRIVVVVERTGTEENPGFVVGYSIEQGEEVLPGSARQTDCSLCTRTELLERIRGELPGLLKLARQHQVAAVADGGEEGADAGEGEGGDADGGDGGDGDGGEPKAIGPLGFAGIGVGVLGLAGVGVGVGFAVRGFVPKGPDYLTRTNYQTPGNIVLSIGGAALIAGVVMIAVDVTKRKKQRASRKAESKVWVEPRGAGIAF